MWLMTPRGFYSAVQKRNDLPDRVTVRARVKDDLDNLRDLLPDAEPYQERFGTDYPWRINIPVSDWARVCAVLALEIDYSNFKDEVKRRQGSKRASVYGSIWSVLLRLEKRAGSAWSGYGGSGYDLFDRDDFMPGERVESALAERQRLDDEARRARAAKPKGKGKGRSSRRRAS